MHKVLSNYIDKKDEILKLLIQADNVLKRLAPIPYDSQRVSTDLQVKQDMSITLREATEEMLCKLRDLCSTSLTVTALER